MSDYWSCPAIGGFTLHLMISVSTTPGNVMEEKTAEMARMGNIVQVKLITFGSALKETTVKSLLGCINLFAIKLLNIH